MKKLKYIIRKDGSSTGSAVLFGDGLKHSEVAHKDNIISAGFCYISPDEADSDRWKVVCFGESTSLEIKSRPVEDAKVISFMINDFF